MGRLEPHVEQTLHESRARIVVTGAGGWIGMATLELLAAALGPEFPARVCCFGSSQRTLTLLDGTAIELQPLEGIASLDAQPTLVLHFAFLTKDRAETMDEQAYMQANRQLDRTVLEALDTIGAEAVFVASSGAAARADDPHASPAMRLYGGLKRDQEAQFAAWAERAQKRVVVARIFNLSGPYINKQRSYALGSFILDALDGGPISVVAPHRVTRTYVAVRELMSLGFAILLDGSNGMTRFDTGGEPMEMQDVAEAVAALLGPVAIERPPVDASNGDSYAGDGDAYRALLARHGITPVPFARQVVETAEFITLFQTLSNANRVAMEGQPC